MEARSHGCADLSSNLSQNCSEAAEAPPHRCSWARIAREQVLARESHGAFSSQNSSCVVKVNGCLARKSQDLSHTWESQVQDVYLSSEKHNKLIAPQLSNRYRNIESRLVATLVHGKFSHVLWYCSRITKSIRSDIFCTRVHNAVEKTGYTNDTHTTAPTTNIGALPRRCRPFSLKKNVPYKSRTKENTGLRMSISPFAHERQCEALRFRDQPFLVHMTRAPLGK